MLYEVITNADERIEKTIQETIDFFKAMGMPVTLRDADLGEEAIDEIMTQFIAHGKKNLGEHGIV